MEETMEETGETGDKNEPRSSTESLLNVNQEDVRGRSETIG